MSNLTITIRTDDAAAEHAREQEVARILRMIAENIEADGIPGYAPLRDRSGKTVGWLNAPDEDEQP